MLGGGLDGGGALLGGRGHGGVERAGDGGVGEVGEGVGEGAYHKGDLSVDAGEAHTAGGIGAGGLGAEGGEDGGRGEGGAPLGLDVGVLGDGDGFRLRGERGAGETAGDGLEIGQVVGGGGYDGREMRVSLRSAG